MITWMTGAAFVVELPELAVGTLQPPYQNEPGQPYGLQRLESENALLFAFPTT